MDADDADAKHSCVQKDKGFSFPTWEKNEDAAFLTSKLTDTTGRSGKQRKDAMEIVAGIEGVGISNKPC
jgi:hypothetical protein